jgi:hypothetical protein
MATESYDPARGPRGFKGAEMSDVVIVKLDEDGADEERIEELTLALRHELSALDEVSVNAAEIEAPENTRAITAAALGTLLVSFKGPISSFLSVVKAWLKRSPSTRSVELTIGDRTIKIGNATNSQQELLFQEFLKSVESTPKG